MADFLKSYVLGLEDIDTTTDVEVTPEEEQAADEAVQQAENVRQEAEDIADQAGRAVDVVNELDVQNDAIKGVMETNGGTLPPEAAAGFQAARRMAAVAVGMNPDEGVGEELVDEAGLESMTNGVMSLEANEKAKDGIWEAVKRMFKGLRERVMNFIEWLSKFFTIIPKRYKTKINQLKEMEDSAFDAAVERIDENAEVRKWLTPKGVLMDFNTLSKKVENYMEEAKVGFFEGRKLNSLIDDKKIDEAKKLHDSIFARFAGRPLEIGVYTHMSKFKEGVFTAERTEVAAFNKKLTFTRTDLINALSIGLRADSVFRKIEKSIKDIKDQIKKYEEQIDKGEWKVDYAADAKILRQFTRNSMTLISRVLGINSDINKARQSYLSIGGTFVPSKAEDK
nr:MAG TPA: hypothetical protein [Caudoviricetes sp.]